MKRLVLVRRVDDPRAQRWRDPLDALKESLAARGYEARIVEVGPGEDASLRDLDRLEDEIAGRLYTGGGRSGRAELLGADAGAVVAKLGADAIVGYHRLQDQLPPLPPPAPAPAWGVPYPLHQARPARRPSGALSLLAASGAVAWFPWGGRSELEPGALINPAEAIDALLAALAGRDGGDDDDG